MPKRTDIRTILILGSGPIIIGQGCEFDYSGTQACKALKAEGYRVVLVNSNPATIMTDPGLSDRTYIEPITPEAVRKVIAKQKEMGDPIDAVLATLGGQTALNCACALYDDGTLETFGVEMIGASREVIHRAEDRERFRRIVEGLRLGMPRAKTVTTAGEAREFLKEIGLPAVIRPAFTLGGSGGGIAYNTEEYDEIVGRGLRASMIGQVQIDESVIGWKEFELEVVRDRKDNCVIVCGIENIDPMGVHTGDSITVAPIQTLTDKEYQAMRDAAIAIMRAVGVETGGSNVQFAVDPKPADGRFRMVVVEMNPRVSRSSALASKATGFPIAKIAAKLAVGYTLDELRNDITGTTSACFEPAIDYVVTKMPRWTFEKFPEADETLTTQMKSVGEGMAIGRTFQESLQKVIRSMEVKRFGLGLDRNDKWLAARRAGESGLTADGQEVEWPIPEEKLHRKLSVPSQGRLYYVRYALKLGWSVEKVSEVSRIDPFFIDQVRGLVEFEDELCRWERLEDVPAEVLFRAKRMGYSDAQLANLYTGRIKSETILDVRARRKALGIEPVYKLVDTCAAEFEAVTPYFYSTYERSVAKVGDASRSGEAGVGGEGEAVNGGYTGEDEARISAKKKVVIIGGGPNRIGQGIEFDYCCCHAAYAARELGFESVMINSNPETVSTDYDTSDLLFFEPLTLEDVLNVIERLNGRALSAPPAEDRAGGGAKADFGVQARGSRNGLGDGVGSGGAGVEGGGLVHGVIVQFGGQTPLNLARGLTLAGAPIIGTSVDSIDLAEDRDRFDALLGRLGLNRPASGVARSIEQAVEIAGRIGYPVLVRPSYVLGGRGMEICPDESALRHYMATAVNISELDLAPVLIDRFLDDATEVDVDVVADFSGEPGEPGEPGVPGDGAGRAVICGIMEHIEQAGIHSGDSACTIPAWSLDEGTVERVAEVSRHLARELRVRGLMNVQMAVKDGLVYILEVNPRASRTAPFVSKATRVAWPRVAAKVMMGKTLDELNVREADATGAFAVKESVFPFAKFPGVDVVLGPEMRSTGEVMGLDRTFEVAFAKGQMASGVKLPTSGAAFVSVRNADKERAGAVARELSEMGFMIYASSGTAAHLERAGVRASVLQKIAAGARPNVIDLMSDGKITLVINTPTRTGWKTDEGRIRASAVRLGVPMITTATGAVAAVRAIRAMRERDWDVAALQDYASVRTKASDEAGVRVIGGGAGAAR